MRRHLEHARHVIASHERWFTVRTRLETQPRSACVGADARVPPTPLRASASRTRPTTGAMGHVDSAAIARVETRTGTRDDTGDDDARPSKRACTASADAQTPLRLQPWIQAIFYDIQVVHTTLHAVADVHFVFDSLLHCVGTMTPALFLSWFQDRRGGSASRG